MDAFCVSCGKQNIPEADSWKRYRCAECWALHKKLGGIQSWCAPIRTSASGMKTGGQQEFTNYARFCRRCGYSLRFSEKRVRYALLRGGECLTCDDCHNHEKKPEWYPDPYPRQHAR